MGLLFYKNRLYEETAYVVFAITIKGKQDGRGGGICLYATAAVKLEASLPGMSKRVDFCAGDMLLWC